MGKNTTTEALLDINCILEGLCLAGDQSTSGAKRNRLVALMQCYNVKYTALLNKNAA